MQMTEHFRLRWRQRVDSVLPTPKGLSAMIRGAVCVQKYREVFTPRGRRITILAAFWLPDLNIIVKADMRRNCAITVITPNIRESGSALDN